MIMMEESSVDKLREAVNSVGRDKFPEADDFDINAAMELIEDRIYDAETIGSPNDPTLDLIRWRIDSYRRNLIVARELSSIFNSGLYQKYSRNWPKDIFLTGFQTIVNMEDEGNSPVFFEKAQAAMYKALDSGKTRIPPFYTGNKGRIERHIEFSRPLPSNNGRGLSTNNMVAIKDLSENGIDIHSVDESDITSYRNFVTKRMDEMRRDCLFIKITDIITPSGQSPAFFVYIKDGACTGIDTTEFKIKPDRDIYEFSVREFNDIIHDRDRYTQNFSRNFEDISSHINNAIKALPEFRTVFIDSSWWPERGIHVPHGQEPNLDNSTHFEQEADNPFPR
jgi:hypothetical protein